MGSKIVTDSRQDEDNCLRLLTLGNPEDDDAFVRARRQEGTCHWITNHHEYSSWRNYQGPGLLWISGNPGCGKSVLSRFLIDQISSEAEHETLAFFYFDDKTHNRKTAIDMIRVLLTQILQQMPAAFRHILQDYKQQPESLTSSFRLLWRVFRQITLDHNLGKLVLVIDGLDECEPDSRKLFLRALVELLTPLRSQQGHGRVGYAYSESLRVAITSRIIDDITHLLKEYPCIHIRPAETKDDIDAFISHSVGELAVTRGYPQDLKYDIEQLLKNNADGMFLWVRIVLNHLDNRTVRYNEEAIRRRLSELPVGLYETYDRILQDIASIHVEYARLIFKWLVLAEYPLTLDQLNMALWTRVTDRTISEVEHRTAFCAQSELILICGAFIHVEDDTVKLIHQSAKEFLLVHTDATHSALSTYFIDPPRDHATLAEICLTFLSFTDFEDCFYGDELHKYIQQYPFLQYAGENWYVHCRYSGADALSPLLLDKFLQSSMAKYVYWPTPNGVLNDDMRDCISSSSPLHLASLLGHPRVIERMIQRTEDIKAKNSEGATPLRFAMEIGDYASVKMLLEAGADANDTDYLGRPLLLQAFDLNNVPVMEIFLQSGADGAALYPDNTPLVYRIAQSGNDAALCVLLAHNVDVNVKTTVGSTPLHAAANNGHESIVLCLLKRGANVNAVDSFLSTPCQKAALNGDVVTVQHLIEAGAELEAQDCYRLAPLHQSVINGHHSVVKLLLTLGVESNVRSCNGSTPLHYAAEKGHASIVAALLSKGADPNVTDMFQSTPLHRAASGGHKTVVRMLLEAGANPIARDNEDWTPAELAAGFDDVIEMLSEIGHTARDSRGCPGKVDLEQPASWDLSRDLSLLHQIKEKLSADHSPWILPLGLLDHKRALGIDFGTSYLCIATYENSQVQVIP